MSERPEEMKDWLAYHREAPAILDYMTHLEDLLAEAQADSKRLDKVFANGQSFRIYDRNGHMTVWSVDSREAIDKLEEP